MLRVLIIYALISHIGQAIVSAVTSGSKRFFLGTDSAPHERRRKECSCGCAGIYNAPVALSLYTKIFEQVNSVKISCFTCHMNFFLLMDR